MVVVVCLEACEDTELTGVSEKFEKMVSVEHETRGLGGLSMQSVNCLFL